VSTALGTSTLEDTYAQAVPGLVLPWSAAPAPDPQVVVLDEDLATELSLDAAALRTSGLLVGQVPDGVRPVAQAYSGHQFGMYQPRLGDGRAVLLGEIVAPDGTRHDLHLKGSGRTPFARGGDGKAALGPMLREYLMGVAMHALGIPTSRGLAVSTTGERVPRDGGLLPGAVLARVASSHLRSEPSSTPRPPATPTSSARSPTTPSPATTRTPRTPRSPTSSSTAASSTPRPR
jgi:uncharacterized protein YdiU (UPF0061 family)